MKTGKIFLLEDGHTVQVREGSSGCCPWALDYAHEIGVPLAVSSDITTWALVDGEEVYIINHRWYDHTRSDMCLNEWLEENIDTYAGKLREIKENIDKIKDETELVKTMSESEKAAFFAGKRGARLENTDIRKKAQNFDVLVNYLEAKLNTCRASFAHTRLDEQLVLQAKCDTIEDIFKFISEQ